MSTYQPGEGDSVKYMEAKKRPGGLSGPLTFAIIVVAVIFVMSVSFRVENIQVVGNSHYTAEEIINAIDIEEGDNLFFFDRFAAITRVFAKLPYIEEVSLERALPDRVTIRVTENNAVAYVKIGLELWTFDEKCKVLGRAAEGEEEGLIPIVGLNPGTIFINEPLQTADNDQRTIDYLRAILYQCVERGISFQVSKIDFSNTNNVILYYGGKYIVRLGDPYATEHKFSMVLSAISQLKEGDIGIIDVTDASTVHFTPY
ncbi:MAG: FtsQ-type POTRA domain-containing protein [Oscillospiraceae bacterium]|jgi:cell division protein FtsQ|nr:FtsQ-type POTRA domain-containing protein [Oscillospiraceae bacterium]